MCRESLDCLDGQARWTPHEENLVDCLTKVVGNAARLHDFMRNNVLQLEKEGDILATRKEYRDTTGKANPRPSKSGVSECVSDEMDIFQMVTESVRKAPWE